MLQFSSVDYKRQLHSRSQGKTQTPQKTQPVKAQRPVTEPMGSRVSKDKPTAFSSHHGTTGSSAGRELKTSDERNSSAARRSSSQQPEQRQPYSGNSPKCYPEKNASTSEYDNYKRGAYQIYDSTTSSLRSNATNRGNSNVGGTVIRTLIDSSVSHRGRDAAASSDANYWKAPTLQSCIISQPRGSSDAPIALIHTSAITSSGPSESNSRMNGRRSRATDRSGDTRIRSASQGLRNLGNTQPEQTQNFFGNSPKCYPENNYSTSEYDNGKRGAYQRYDRTTSSSMSDATSRGNSKVDGTVIRTLIDSLVPHYETSAGVSATTTSPDAYYWKSQTGQCGLISQPRGSSNAQIAPMHTSAITSSGPYDSNDWSNGRQSRTTDRSGDTRIRSASQGLRNLGNTCYMNSILQCLAKVPWFRDVRERHLKFTDDLLNEFFSLMKKMQENDSDDSSLDPYQFRQQISSLGFRFSSSEQNDAHEFLLCLLSRLSKTLKSEGKTDLVGDFLLGRQQNVIRFKECGHVLINNQPFFSLSLPLTLDSGKSMFRGATVDLRQCLENYTRTEDVDGDALCMDCQLMQRCSIEASFNCPPKILIIHLKRYDFTRAEKLENEVSFPLDELRIKQTNLNPSGEVLGCNDIVYDLIAVCNHYGSLRFGHYTADIKSPSSNNWYNYSDSRVTQVSKPSTSRDVCILFYRQSHS